MSRPSSDSNPQTAIPAELWSGVARGDIALRDVLRVDARLIAQLVSESESLARQNLPIDAAIVREGLAALEPDRPEHWEKAAELYQRAGSFDRAQHARQRAQETQARLTQLDWGTR